MEASVFSLDQATLAAIAGMAVATYITRIAGYWLVSRVALRGRIAGMLEAVPGSVLIALIAPMIFTRGPAEAIAAAITVIAAARLPTLAAFLIGVFSVVAIRALIA